MKKGKKMKKKNVFLNCIPFSEKEVKKHCDQNRIMQ